MGRKKGNLCGDICCKIQAEVLNAVLPNYMFPHITQNVACDHISSFLCKYTFAFRCTYITRKLKTCGTGKMLR